jgi:hypothetical protein
MPGKTEFQQKKPCFFKNRADPVFDFPVFYHAASKSRAGAIAAPVFGRWAAPQALRQKKRVVERLSLLLKRIPGFLHAPIVVFCNGLVNSRSPKERSEVSR